MATSTAILTFVVIALSVLNVYQFLIKRAAVRIAEILYVMTRTVREKASEVRRDQKDVEIVEAHLRDIVTSSRSLLRALGYGEAVLGADTEPATFPNGDRIDHDRLFRLADNILYAAVEEAPDAGQEELIHTAASRLMEKVPALDGRAARNVVAAVVRHSERSVPGSDDKENHRAKALSVDS